MLHRILGLAPGSNAHLPTYPDPVNGLNKASFFFYKGFGKGLSFKYGLFHYNTRQRVLKKALKRHFKPNRKTYIICHGWFDWLYPTSWMDRLKDLIYQKAYKRDRLAGRKSRPPNVIIIDWNVRSLSIWCNKVSANSRIVAREAAYLFKEQINHGVYGGKLNFTKFHGVGHSFGAQVLGLLGYTINSGLPKNRSNSRFHEILALDPADQCYYRTDASINFHDSLSFMSAEKVRCIHSNGDIAGTYKRLGHVDIYLNGGATQPGCFADVNWFHSWEICEYC